MKFIFYFKTFLLTHGFVLDGLACFDDIVLNGNAYCDG